MKNTDGRSVQGTTARPIVYQGDDLPARKFPSQASVPSDTSEGMKPLRMKVYTPTPAERASMGELDVLIMMTGALRTVPAASLLQFSPTALSVWAAQNGVYVFPTTELVQWLRELIGKESAIEIGAGNGGIALALGVPATDSYIQTRPDLRATYDASGQAITIPGSHVERLEALEAVERYRPHTVFGAYVTHLWRPNLRDGFIYGVDEEALLRRVRRYVVIGNDASHGTKPIMKRPHRTIRPPWLVTRAIDPALNAIYIWERA